MTPFPPDAFPQRPPHTNGTGPLVAPGGDSYAQRALADEVLAVMQAAEGERNDRLNRAAFSLGQLVAAGDLTENDVTFNLTNAALGAGLEANEIAATIASGLRGGAEHPRERVRTATGGPSAPSGARGIPPAAPGPPVVTETPSDGFYEDLAPYLDGTHMDPEPTIGGIRDDGLHLMYTGKWHTIISLTAAGKSMLALWHCAEEMRSGNHVVYAHFEEASPSGTLSRLLAFGVSREMILQRFHWINCTWRWSGDVLANQLEELFPTPVLLVLDGINAACAQRGWPVDKPEGVGAYRHHLVSPATNLGITVLSLGHPPKARDRQVERHGFGSTAWLDEVDGVGIRLEASKDHPIRRGHDGTCAIYVVKDRYGQVEKHGVPDERREPGWYYIGSFVVSSSRDTIAGRISIPTIEKEENTGLDPIDLLGREVLQFLGPQGEFSSQVQLRDRMRAARMQFSNTQLPVALERLAADGSIAWPDMPPGVSRRGWVIDSAMVLSSPDP